MDPKQFRDILPIVLERRPRPGMNISQKRKTGIKEINLIWQFKSKPCEDCDKVVARVITWTWDADWAMWKKKCENCGKKRWPVRETININEVK